MHALNIDTNQSSMRELTINEIQAVSGAGWGSVLKPVAKWVGKEIASSAIGEGVNAGIHAGANWIHKHFK